MIRPLCALVVVVCACNSDSKAPSTPPPAAPSRSVDAHIDAPPPGDIIVSELGGEPGALDVSGHTLVWMSASHHVVALDPGATSPRVLATDGMDVGKLVRPLSVSGTAAYYLRAGMGHARVASVDLTAPTPVATDVTRDVVDLVGIHAAGRNVFLVVDGEWSDRTGLGVGKVLLARSKNLLKEVGSVALPSSITGDATAIVVGDATRIARFDVDGVSLCPFAVASFGLPDGKRMIYGDSIDVGAIVEYTSEGNKRTIARVSGLPVAGQLRGRTLFVAVVPGRKPANEIEGMLSQAWSDLDHAPVPTQILRVDLDSGRVTPMLAVDNGLSRHFVVDDAALYFATLHPSQLRRIAAP